MLLPTEVLDLSFNGVTGVTCPSLTNLWLGEWNALIGQV